MADLGPEYVDVVIEIPRGRRNKYEFDEARGVMRLDRRIIGAITFPADYGFVPETLAEDGDPLDALVLLEEPAFPGIWVRARVIGVFWVSGDDAREPKLVCTAQGDPAYDGVDELEDLPAYVIGEIEQFFDTYKDLEPGKWSRTDERAGAMQAWQAVERARAEYRNKHKNNRTT